MPLPCLYSSGFILMNIPSPLCRGLESCPCTPAPWGPASGQLWLADPAVCLSLHHHTSSHLSSPPPTGSCHPAVQRICPICLDFHPPNMCLHVPPSSFQVHRPVPVWPTFSQLIRSQETTAIIISFIMYLLCNSSLNPSFSPAVLVLLQALGAVWLLAEEIKGPLGQWVSGSASSFLLSACSVITLAHFLWWSWALVPLTRFVSWPSLLIFCLDPPQKTSRLTSSPCVRESLKLIAQPSGAILC